MTAPSFHRTLHFRITGVFLVLLGLLFAGYYVWVERTIYAPVWAPGEEVWYEECRETEADSLAVLIASAPGTGASVLADYGASVLADYGARISGFDSELAVVDTAGAVLASTRPDSLTRVLRFVDPSLLAEMSEDDWDFDVYPEPYDMDDFVNRITDVVPLAADGDAAPSGWLVSSFKPLQVSTADLEDEDQIRQLRGVGAILVFAFLSGLVIMAWVSRRIRILSADMLTFREGDYDHRAREGNGDEIAVLGGDFNRMAERLNDVIARLKQSEAYRKHLVANISHDLRTPMASLRGHVETLTLHGDGLSSEARAKALRTIAANTDNLEALIERLFELTYLESGRVEYRCEVFSIVELAHEVTARCETRAAETGVTLHCDIEGDPPLVDADPLRIGQVLQNLVENAVKFNREGGEVHLRVSGDGDRVDLEVRDTGIGIASEDLPHVFERFYTAEKSRTAKSSGLGLAIAHHIVSGHGGELTVESREGDGTAFRFSLPSAELPED